MSRKELENHRTITNDVFRGAICALPEVIINHPFVVYKIRRQQGQPRTLKLKKLYRGAFTNILSMVPITVCQVAITSILQSSLKCSINNDNVSTSIAAFIGGAVGSLIASPAENIMGYLIKNEVSLGKAVSTIYLNNGLKSFWRGHPATTGRDGIFTVFYLAIPQYLKSILSKSVDIEPNLALSFAASILSGIFAAILTQPLDTIKVRQNTYNLSFFDSTKNIIDNQGVMGLWKGGFPRGLRVMSAITLMAVMSEKLLEYFDKQTIEMESKLGILESTQTNRPK